MLAQVLPRQPQQAVAADDAVAAPVHRHSECQSSHTVQPGRGHQLGCTPAGRASRRAGVSRATITSCHVTNKFMRQNIAFFRNFRRILTASPTQLRIQAGVSMRLEKTTLSRRGKAAIGLARLARVSFVPFSRHGFPCVPCCPYRAAKRAPGVAGRSRCRDPGTV